MKLPVRTWIYFSPTPPESVTAWESVSFSTYLYYSTDSAQYPLAGVPVELWVDYSKVASGYTDSLGRCIISHSFTRGTHLIYAHFPGWELGWPPVWYPPSTTPVYTITAVGVETRITEVDAPPSDVGIGEPFYVSGYLKEVLPPPPEGPGPRGLLDKTVKLYVDGSMVRSERTGFSVPKGWPDYDPGRWRFAVPAPQTLGVHTVMVGFIGDDNYEPCLWFIEFNAIESEVVATIEPYWIPTKVAPGEDWTGTYYLCNRGTGAGNVRAVVITKGGVISEIPILTMPPGECVRLKITGSGPTSFTIRTGV